MLILIADDDRLARYTLKSLLRDLDDGNFVIVEATNGKTLVEQCSRLHPDIAFVDIDMPQLDGLSAIATCKELSPYTQFVITSGYTEFGYARKSIALQVSDYLVKPIERELLEPLMQKLMYTISHTRSQINMNFQVRAARQLRLWEEIGYSPMEDPCSENCGSYYSFVFLLDIRPGSGAYTNAYLQLNTGLHQIGLQCEKQSIPWISWRTKEDYLEFIVFCDSQTYLNLKSQIEKLCSVDSNCAVSCMAFQGADLWTLFQSTLDNTKYAVCRFGTPPGSIIVPEKLSFTDKEYSLFSSAAELTDAFQNANETQYEKSLPAFRDLSACQSSVIKNLVPLLDIGLNGNFCKNDVRRLYEELKLHKQNLYLRAGLERSDKITNAVEFMKKHYMQDISVSQIAEKLNMTPNYFSRLFHEGTGQTFSCYLSTLRINQAKRLLSTRLDIPVKDIALMVGYFSSRHFSKVFKNITGCSPSEFREKNSR